MLINYGCAISYVGKQVCRLYYYFVYYLASGGLIYIGGQEQLSIEISFYIPASRISFYTSIMR